MDIREYVIQSWDRLRVYKLRSILAAAGIAAGVAMLIVTASLIESYRSEMTRGFETLGSMTFFIESERNTFHGGKPPAPLTADDVDAINRAFPSGVHAMPSYAITGQVAACGTTIPVIIQGVTLDFERLMQLPPASPRWFGAADMEGRRAGVVIGSAVKEKLRCQSFESKLDVSTRPFQIVGVLEPAGMRSGTDIDSVVMMPAATFVRVYGTRIPVARVAVRVETGGNTLLAQDIASRVLRTRHSIAAGDTPDFRVYDAADAIETSRRLAHTLKLVALTLLATAVVVGMIGLLNSVTMAVRERAAEIGIRRVVGARRQSIARHFLIEGTAIGACGAAGGSLTGCVISVIVERILKTPAVIDVSTMTAVLCTAVVMSAFTSTVPAIAAARLNVIEAVQRQ